MRWFLLLFAALLVGYFLWIRGQFDSFLPEKLNPMTAGETKNAAAAPETPDAAPPEKVEIKSIAPEPKKGEKVYTEEDIKKINEKIEKDSPKKNAFTNADLKKYKERPGKPDIEQARKDIQWAEEPAAKKPKKQ